MRELKIPNDDFLTPLLVNTNRIKIKNHIPKASSLFDSVWSKFLIA